EVLVSYLCWNCGSVMTKYEESEELIPSKEVWNLCLDCCADNGTSACHSGTPDYGLINNCVSEGIMEKDYKMEIEEIISGVQCEKDFQCYKSWFENLCKAEDIGLGLIVQCLEKEAQDCKFSIPFGSSYLCECHLRCYIAAKLGK
ncbi:hypothetical protein ACFLVA_01550, partial [Chloroflexota bacterium]